MEAILLDIWDYICNITLSNVIAFCALLVSIYALHSSKKANEKSNALTKQINSKEYQLNENLKEMAVQIISVVRSVDAKAALALENEKTRGKRKYKIDYSYEINLLSKILSSPAYMLFLKAIEKDDNRLYIEYFMHRLVLIISSEIEFDDLQKIRNWSSAILDQLQYNKNIDYIKDDTLRKYIDDFCQMKGVLTREY